MITTFAMSKGSELTTGKGEEMNLKNLLSCSTIRLLLVAGASCLLVQSANATLIFQEPFNEPVGPLSGAVNNDSVAWSGGNSGLNIVSGDLTYPGLVDQGGNELQIVNASAGSSVNTFANQTSGQIYYSFLFDPTVVDSGNQYFTAMNPSGGGPNGGSDAIDAYSYSSGKIEVRANAGSATAGTGTALTLGTTYLIVEEIDLTGLTASLWIDPASSTFGGTAPTATASISPTTATAVDDVGFKAEGGTGSYLVDNLLIGTTWADVTPAVPEPSTWALVGSGLALMLGAVRRRRS